MLCAPTLLKSRQKRSPLPGLECLWTKTMIFPSLSGPTASVRVADLGALCQAAVSLHPTSLRRCRGTGCSQPADSWEQLRAVALLLM